MTRNRSAALGRTLGIGAGLLAVATLATACGGGNSSSAAPPASAPASAGAQGGAPGGAGQGGPGGQRPGTSGKISAVNPTSIFVVQSASGAGGGGQVTVNFTGTTTFTRTAMVSASAVKVGDCVTAAERPAGGGSRPTATPSASATRPAAIMAATVTITSTSGTCAQTQFGGGAPNARRSAAPRPDASASPRGGRSGRGFGGGFGAAFGTVTSVTGNGFVVSETRGNASSAPSAPAAVTVTTSSTTTYDETLPATKAALVVGQCATAVGTTDDTGAVTARTIAVRPSTNGTCSAGFGGGFGRFRSAQPTAGA